MLASPAPPSTVSNAEMTRPFEITARNGSSGALPAETSSAISWLPAVIVSGCVVAVCGDADLYASASVEHELVRLADEGHRSIVVDLTEATFIDASMLRVLLKVSKRLRSGGGELLVVCHERNIRKIFEITLLDRVFTIFGSRGDALAELAASPSLS